jgi:hypothetical protein
MKHRIFLYCLFSVILAPASSARTVTIEEYEANKERVQSPQKYVQQGTSLSQAESNADSFMTKKICNKKSGKAKNICIRKNKILRKVAGRDTNG